MAAHPPMTRYRTPCAFRWAQRIGKSGWFRSAGKGILLLEACQLFERVEALREGSGEGMMEFVVQAERGVGLPEPIFRRQALGLLQFLVIDPDDTIHDVILLRSGKAYQ